MSEYKGTRGPRGLFHGKGVAKFASGNIYTGEFEHGHLHGQGKFTWEDGLEYTGGFLLNKITGRGVSAECPHETHHVMLAGWTLL